MSKDLKKKQEFMYWLKSLFCNSSRFTLRFLEEGDYYSAFLIDRKAFQQLREDPDASFKFETERIGIFFGYGKENARFYLRRVALGKYLRKFMWPFLREPSFYTLMQQRIDSKYYGSDVPFIIDPPVNPQFTSFEEEWNWMKQNEQPYEEWDKPPFWIRKPAFISKKSEETNRILKNFNNGATQLGAVLHDDHWFERVLEIIEAE